MDRAIAFTDPENRPTSLNKVRALIKENGYPKDFVEKIIRKRVHRFYNSNTKSNENDGKRYVSTPYIPGLSERLKKTLRNHDIILSTKTTNKVNNAFTRTKYKVSNQDKSKLVYKVKCLGCVGTYIGDTKQKTKNRIYRHDLDIKNKKKEGASMLTQHAISTGHKFDTENVEILEHAANYWSRKRAEAIHILKDQNAVNFKRDSNGIHSSYINIFTKHPNTK